MVWQALWIRQRFRTFIAQSNDHRKPLPVLISSLDQINDLAVDVPELFWTLADKYLPGPLTIILKKNPELSMACLDPNSVAIRFSSHEATQKIAHSYGKPMFLSSANISGHTNACSVDEIEESLGDHVAAIVDDGPLDLPEPSTIISLTDEQPKIIRQGKVKVDEVG